MHADPNDDQYQGFQFTHSRSLAQMQRRNPANCQWSKCTLRDERQASREASSDVDGVTWLHLTPRINTASTQYVAPHDDTRTACSDSINEAFHIATEWRTPVIAGLITRTTTALQQLRGARERMKRWLLKQQSFRQHRLVCDQARERPDLK